MQGRFLSIEGPDGAGKSTLAARLRDRLSERGIDVLLTREPGDGPLGPQIRGLLLEGAAIDPWTEVFLFLADRRQHVESMIRPTLEQGTWVLCDRYVDSTVVYQGYGRDLNLGLLRKLNRIATSGLMPDVTLLLDLDTQAALSRIGSHGLFDGETTRSRNDRLDAEPVEFHRRVREGFLAEARLDPERIRVLDADRPTDQIVDESLQLIGA